MFGNTHNRQLYLVTVRFSWVVSVSLSPSPSFSLKVLNSHSCGTRRHSLQDRMAGLEVVSWQCDLQTPGDGGSPEGSCSRRKGRVSRSKTPFASRVCVNCLIEGDAVPSETHSWGCFHMHCCLINWGKRKICNTKALKCVLFSCTYFIECEIGWNVDAMKMFLILKFLFRI